MSTEVYDGWARWTCRIETKQTRRGPRWRYVLERHFAGRRDDRHGLWRKTEERAVADGERKLRAKAPSRYETVRRL